MGPLCRSAVGRTGGTLTAKAMNRVDAWRMIQCRTAELGTRGARINSLSNSASPPKTVTIKRPCAVVVSAHVSCSERKRAPLAATLASVSFAKEFNRARQFAPVGLGSAGRLAEHAHGSGGLQRRNLSVERRLQLGENRIAHLGCRKIVG